MHTGKLSRWLGLGLILNISIMVWRFWVIADQVIALLPYRTVNDWISDPCLYLIFYGSGFVGIQMPGASHARPQLGGRRGSSRHSKPAAHTTGCKRFPPHEAYLFTNWHVPLQRFRSVQSGESGTQRWSRAQGAILRPHGRSRDADAERASDMVTRETGRMMTD